jgi:phosphatidylglycerophosphate synthase
MKEDIQRGKRRPFPTFIQNFLETLSDLCIKLHLRPNQATLISLLFALLAGVGLYLGENRWLLLLAVLFMLVSVTFDGLDGLIARKTGTANKTGDFLDCVADEVSDSFIFVGIAFSGLCATNLAFLALILKLLISSIGLSARVVGASTIGKGLLHRGNRFLFLTGTGIIEGLFQFGKIWHSLTLFDLLMLYFILAGIVTIFQRIIETFAFLKEEQA